MISEPIAPSATVFQRLAFTLHRLFFLPGALSCASAAGAQRPIDPWALYGLVGLILAACLQIPTPTPNSVAQSDIQELAGRPDERHAQRPDAQAAPPSFHQRWDRWRRQRASAGGLPPEVRWTMRSSQAIVWYLLVPVPMLLLGLLYSRRGHRWSLHVDFAVRLHSFVVLLMSLLLALEALIALLPLALPFAVLRLLLMPLWPLLWLWLALRRVYGAGVLGTTVRAMALVLVGYGAVLLPASLAIGLARRLFA